MNKGYLAFDLDGTLFRTEEVAVYSLQKTIAQLKEKGLYERSEPSKEECTHVLGMINEEIWQSLIPNASAKAVEEANELLVSIEIQCLKQGMGSLYQGVEKTITSLEQQGFGLLVVSNGGEVYVETVIETMGLSPYFSHIYSAGKYNTQSKTDLLALARKDYPSLRAMIGDRRSDVLAGKGNTIYTFGCAYGYGSIDEIQGAHRIIQEIQELLQYLNELPSKP